MALAMELDSLDKIPVFQQSWYVRDSNTNKFKLDMDKVDIEDTTNLRKTLEEVRKEAKAAKTAASTAVQEALKPFEGLDPVKVRELMGQFDDAEEAKLLARGKEGIESIINKRMSKAREEFEKQLKALGVEKTQAQNRATAYQGEVLENKVRIVLEKAGLHPGAIDDALLHARRIFSLDENRRVVQFEEDGTTVVLGKDGKTPFSPIEWIESMKENKPHWFPASNSGGNSHTSSSGTTASGLKTIKRSEFDRLPHHERKNWAKPGQVVPD